MVRYMLGQEFERQSMAPDDARQATLTKGIAEGFTRLYSKKKKHARKKKVKKHKVCIRSARMCGIRNLQWFIVSITRLWYLILTFFVPSTP